MSFVAPNTQTGGPGLPVPGRTGGIVRSFVRSSRDRRLRGIKSQDFRVYWYHPHGLTSTHAKILTFNAADAPVAGLTVPELISYLDFHATSMRGWYRTKDTEFDIISFP